VLRRIAFVVFAQRAPTGKDWSRLSSQWTARIEERIAELQRLKAGLTECIGCGCLSLGRCQFANPADRAARLGSGPRYWIGDRPRA
jgi:MerR family redox-sensitive transcriptional activator SoxR